MIQEIIGCKDCPLFIDEYTACGHPEHSVDGSGNGECSAAFYNDLVLSPNWCPLNKESITIIKKTK